MTYRELRQLHYLNLEIKQDQERLMQLRSEMSGISGMNLSGIPHGTVTSSQPERLAIEIAEIETTIKDKLLMCYHQRSRIERYIAQIQDSLTRQIFTLRFVKDFSWSKVAFIIGGGNSADSVRMHCQRYINSQK